MCRNILYHKNFVHFLIPIALFLELSMKQALKIQPPVCGFSFSRFSGQ